jgi:hypothetical protein
LHRQKFNERSFKVYEQKQSRETLNSQAMWSIPAKASEYVVRNGTFPSAELAATQLQQYIE